MTAARLIAEPGAGSLTTEGQLPAALPSSMWV